MLKINYENLGDLELKNPTFDFYIKKGDLTISRNIDEVDYNFDLISIGEKEIFKATYIGYNNYNDLPKGDYILKVDLKEGTGIKVISTTSISINLK